MTQSPSAQTIQALEKQLVETTVEAYTLQERLEAAREKIKSLRVALGGVRLGTQSNAASATVSEPEVANAPE